jgi:hypothetical protein
MFGGYSFLSLLNGKLDNRQARLFKAGHAHAGVLLILSLAYYYYMSLTSLSLSVQYFGCSLLALGIILQSGGFFWSAFLDTPGKRPTGMFITTGGAILLVGAIIVLITGLAGM